MAPLQEDFLQRGLFFVVLTGMFLFFWPTVCCLVFVPPAAYFSRQRKVGKS